MRILLPIVSVLLVAMLSACAKPLPADRADYAGDWRGNGVSLLITPEGQVVYHRQDGGSTVSIDAPLKAFDGDDFEVGVGPLVTRFDVGQPPTESDGEWTMEVDGRMLRREDGESPKSKGELKA
ncbi:hypothetical protein [Silanimonas sp.]|uniref:hypothetical protein n=1 Tax=Silanimonas sp. TaxID=1929290 RepID=UPI0022BD0B07|nr:hypothetical protein [Silanimonas sp.]MCZ8164581.1 hypothetical protein [Silanimonas sp.]